MEGKDLVKLFNLSKTDKGPTCAANRCKEYGTAAPGTYWGKEEVKLCNKHLDQLIAFAEANPDYEPEAPAEEAPTGDPVTVGMNLVALNNSVEPFAVEGEEIVDFVGDYKITTQQELETVAKVIAQIKLKLADLEMKEKELTVPLSTVLNKIRDIFRPVKQRFKDAEQLLKAQIEAVKILEAANRRKAMEEAVEAHKQGDALAVVKALQRNTVVGDVKGVSTTSKWKFIIVDESLIPREFLMPNEKLIKEHCAHSTDRQPTPIPGVEFVPDVAVSVTASKVLS